MKSTIWAIAITGSLAMLIACGGGGSRSRPKVDPATLTDVDDVFDRAENAWIDSDAEDLHVEAIPLVNRLLELQPDHLDGLLLQAQILDEQATGLYEDDKYAKAAPIYAQACAAARRWLELKKKAGEAPDEVDTETVSFVFYNDACNAALAGKPEDALKSLRESVDAGFTDADLLEEDGDLKSLRDRDEFKELLERVKNGPAPAVEQVEPKVETETDSDVSEANTTTPAGTTSVAATDLPGEQDASDLRLRSQTDRVDSRRSDSSLPGSSESASADENRRAQAALIGTSSIASRIRLTPLRL